MRPSRLSTGLAVSALACTALVSTAQADTSDVAPEVPSANAAASTCFTDPTGDNTVVGNPPQGEPRGDITTFCAGNDGATVSLSLRSAEPTDPASDPAWDGFTGVTWRIYVDPNNPDNHEYTVFYNARSGSVEQNFQGQVCTATKTFDGTTYGISFPSSCIDDRTSFRFDARFNYEADASQSLTAGDSVDSTANVGPVTVGGASEPPPSPSPQPTSPPAPGPTPDEPGTKRLAGSDRYSTAAAIVRDSYPSGPVPVVLIATGEAYADALAGGPAADLLGGPLLPVAKGSIPASILSELDRLDPARIVILGGPGAVSDAVAAQLQQYTTGSVTRIAGVNRYDTAAQVARQVFTGPVPQVLIATGLGFADALAGGAVGTKTDSPVLLVSKDRLPAETAAALRALQPRDIAVLGGAAVVSDAVLQQLREFTTGGVNRLAGSNRYETAAAITRVFWPTTVDVVYLATGLNFPDALAGVPAAGRDAAPLLLVDRTCMPAATKREIDRLQPTTTVVLGGNGTVSDAAAAGSSCTAPA